MIPREKFLQKHFTTPLSHTLCDVKIFFHLDFNIPAVNTFFTATKIFLHSRFINGWYIGKLFCSFILTISLYHHLVKRKRFFTRRLYNFRYTPIVCNDKTFLIFLFLFQIYHSRVFTIWTRGKYFYVKILSIPRVQHLNSSKNFHKEKITQHKLSYFYVNY